VVLHLLSADPVFLALAMRMASPLQRFEPSTDLLLLDRRRDAAVRAVQGNEGSEGHLMAASKQIHLVINIVSSGQPSMAGRAGFC
jgi:hypothetical protein